MRVPALKKPRNTACVHAKPGAGCQIYAQRPNECAGFHCAFLYMPEVPKHWRPKRSRMLLNYDDDAQRMEVHVDPAAPEAWRAAPYYDDLKTWARRYAPSRGQVIVWVGEELTAILPDRDKRLGPHRDGQVLVGMEYETPAGVIYDVIAMDQNDPRLTAPRDAR
jgi:hypothetical protein